jgi:hypothetical protein
MQHIIKKQVIDLSLDKKLDAFFIQQKVSDKYYSKILPMLLKAFDGASNDEEVIEIDSLAIDIGTINSKELEEGGWEERVFKNISEQLIPVNLGLTSQVNALKKSRPISSADQWIFYMRHGYLPWNVLALNEDWYSNVLSAFAADSKAITKLRNLIKNNADSVPRMVSQNSASFLTSLVETLTAENQAGLNRSINEIAEIIASKIGKGKSVNLFQRYVVKQKLWREVLELTASADKNETPSRIAFQLLTNNLSPQQLRSGKAKDFLLKNKTGAALFKKIMKEKENKLIDPKEKISTKEVTGNENINALDTDGIFVSNAGIILLHPFLFRFFKNLNLFAEERFVDKLSHQKALYLLHYLATGNMSPQEYELAIAKILSGYPLEEPVNHSIKLTQQELTESESLLLSAIGQWEILKSTSPDGLREGFLQRNGKLYLKNGILTLQIEQGPIDMLLDHLPWNLSIIKLPWMKDILKVEWR